LADQFEPAESLISWYGNQKSRDGRSICYLRTKSEVDTHNAAARFHNESFHQPPSLDNTAAWLVYGRNLKSLVDLASQQAKQGQSSLVSMSKVTKIPVAIPTEETYFDYQKTLVKLELALEKITFKVSICSHQINGEADEL